jgi:hypothetical protein
VEITNVRVKGSNGSQGSCAQLGTLICHSTVTTVPQLIFDIDALMRLFSSDQPPKQLVRPSASALAFYGFADASSRGFGSTLSIYGNLHYHHGQWSIDVTDESSNFWELSILVAAITEATLSGLLCECELFFFSEANRL